MPAANGAVQLEPRVTTAAAVGGGRAEEVDELRTDVLPGKSVCYLHKGACKTTHCSGNDVVSTDKTYQISFVNVS